MLVSGTQAPNHKDDAALIAGIRAGDQSAMADLYDRYAGVVYGVSLRVLANTTAAEDVVQEVFLQLWRNPQAFDADRGLFFLMIRRPPRSTLFPSRRSSD